MFTVVGQKNLAGAETYFDEHLSQNDYYTTEEVRAGQWIGYGVQRIGLKVEGNVNRESFIAFCENINPQTGERLTQRNKETGKRRVFYDFTCSAPKSVSILAVILDDYRLVTAHEESTKLAFHELESFAATRLRKAGQQKDRITANVIAAAFLHTSSRALDPLLHTHFTVFNCTYDEKESVWKALQAGPMFDAIRYVTEVYRNELARRVHALGYGTERAKHGWEIVGVNETIRLVLKFKDSRRPRCT